MPRSALKAMVEGVPDRLMNELRSDARKPNPITGGANPQPQAQSVRGSGWVQPQPVEPPPGVALAQLLGRSPRSDRQSGTRCQADESWTEGVMRRS